MPTCLLFMFQYFFLQCFWMFSFFCILSKLGILRVELEIEALGLGWQTGDTTEDVSATKVCALMSTGVISPWDGKPFGLPYGKPFHY